MKNKEIREKADRCGVRLWMIAERLGITDATFSRRLRREIPDPDKSAILKIIDELAEQEREHE